MKYALALAAITALVLIPLAARAVWRHFKQTQSTFDRLVDEAAPRKVCRECKENDALPPSACCAVCDQQFADWLDEEVAAIEQGRQVSAHLDLGQIPTGYTVEEPTNDYQAVVRGPAGRAVITRIDNSSYEIELSTAKRVSLHYGCQSPREALEKAVALTGGGAK